MLFFLQANLFPVKKRIDVMDKPWQVKRNMGKGSLCPCP